MRQQRNNSPRTMKKHSNTVSEKENDSSPETKLKVTEDCGLTDREFKTGIKKKLNKLYIRKQKDGSVN